MIDLETNETNETLEREAKDFLDSLEPGEGLKISVTRMGPDWMPGGLGWLKTFDFNQPGSVFNLETLSKLYGGGNYKLQLIGQKGRYIKSASVAVAGFPKLNGQIVVEPSIQQFQQQAQPQPVANSMNEEFLKFLLNQNQKQTSEQMGLLTSLLTQKQPAQVGGNTLGDIAKMVEFVDTIRGNATPNQATDETGSMVQGLVSVLGQILSKPQQTQTAQRPTVPIRQPRQFQAPRVPNPQQIPKNVGVLSRPVLNPTEPQTIEQPEIEQPEIEQPEIEQPATGQSFIMEDEETTLEDMADEIASLNLDDLSYLIKCVLEQLPQEKIQAIISGLGSVQNI